MIERLCKELDGTASHGLNPHPGVSMSGNEDDGNVAFLFFQPGLQLETRHLRHADVNDQASRPIMQIGREEVFRASEALCRKPCRLHKVAQRILHGLVVINDRDQFGLFVHRHTLRVTCLPYLEQSNFGREKLDFSRFDRYFRWIGNSMPTGGLNGL